MALSVPVKRNYVRQYKDVLRPDANTATSDII